MRCMGVETGYEPAFPAQDNNFWWSGMTLRDYFAGQALMGIQARYDHSPDNTAKWSYEMADAMLKARGGG